jgi:hypothetical protein
VRAVASIAHADPPVEAGTDGVYHGAEWTPHPHGLEIELLALVDFGSQHVHCRFEEIERVGESD